MEEVNNAKEKIRFQNYIQIRSFYVIKVDCKFDFKLSEARDSVQQTQNL